MCIAFCYIYNFQEFSIFGGSQFQSPLHVLGLRISPKYKLLSKRVKQLLIICRFCISCWWTIGCSNCDDVSFSLDVICCGLHDLSFHNCSPKYVSEVFMMTLSPVDIFSGWSHIICNLWTLGSLDLLEEFHHKDKHQLLSWLVTIKLLNFKRKLHIVEVAEGSH